MDYALQVREILATRGLTLYGVSRRSAELFGRSSHFYVPHNLYYDLTRTLSVPTVWQMLALSHITDYRLSDWLAVFGFELDAIFRLQLLIPRQHTTVLDFPTYDTHAWIPWFAERPHIGPVPSVAPLGQLLAVAPPRRAIDLFAERKKAFLYGRIGDQDLYALPHFVPGSIVRVDTRRADDVYVNRNRNDEGPFFLLEHDFRWTCSRLIPLAKDRVLLHCPQRPCLERELRIERGVRILGVIDAEIRPLTSLRPSGMAPKSAALQNKRLDSPAECTSLEDLLRRSRMSIGLSFREASSISRWIAERLSDELYFAAASTLSDYEALSGPPRHIQKIIALCILYCIGFDQLLRAARLPLEKAGRESIPDEFIPRQAAGRNHGLEIAGPSGGQEPSGILADLVNQWEEIPLFLRFSLAEITGLKRFSISDVFWVGEDKAQRHPLLVNAAFVVVNRRARKPSPLTEDAICDGPLYVLLKRDGSYLCGHCTLDEGNLVVHSYPRGPVGAQQFRNGADAEVVGQVTTILRRLA